MTDLTYRVRGRRPNMFAGSIAACEIHFEKDFSEVMIGHLLREAPDGLILARSDGRWFEVSRQALVEITRENPGLIVTEKSGENPTIDPVEIWRDVIRGARQFALEMAGKR